MSDYQEVFEANKELSRDECILAIYNSDEDLSLSAAQAEYTAMATEAGIIKSPAKKKVQFEDTMNDQEVDVSTVEGVNAAKAIGADLEIGTATVTKYIKAYAEENDVEVAIATRSKGDSMSGKLNDWFVEVGGEATNDEIGAKAIELGMSERSATYYKSVYGIVKDLRSRLA